MLDRAPYHLAVFDISMTRGGFDKRGLELLLDLYEHNRIDAMAVLVVSGYATVQAASAALGGHPNARLIQKEHFDNGTFLAAAQQLLQIAVPINLHLDVRWQRDGNNEASTANALHNLLIASKRITKKDEPALFERVTHEFDDLLARTFSDAERVVLTPMNPGKSGAGVVKARPFFEHGGGATVVLKFGDVDLLELENKNFDQYVHRYLGGGRFTSIHKRTHTWLLGGTCYSFLGADFVEFPTYYANATTAGVRSSLKTLFEDTCLNWYENATPLQLHDLGREYRESLGWKGVDWRERLQRLKKVQGGDSIEFTSLSKRRKFPNPLRVTSDQPIFCSAHEAITHGDLNANNIMVDRNGMCWLIDFFHTGPGHVLRDFVLLDCWIRWTMLSPAEAKDQRVTTMKSVPLPVSSPGWKRAR